MLSVVVLTESESLDELGLLHIRGPRSRSETLRHILRHQEFLLILRRDERLYVAFVDRARGRLPTCSHFSTLCLHVFCVSFGQATLGLGPLRGQIFPLYISVIPGYDGRFWAYPDYAGRGAA